MLFLSLSFVIPAPAGLAFAQSNTAHETRSMAPASFTRLEPLPPPHITASASAYPGGHHDVTNIVDGQIATEYSSDGLGTNTFIEFDFSAPTTVAAFRHQDRNDPATIAASKLSFLDAAGSVVAEFEVPHVNLRGGVTFFTLRSPVTAQRVRWQVTRLGAGYGTVGGAEISFYRAGQRESAPASVRLEAQALPMLERRGGGLVQPYQVSLEYPYLEPVNAVLRATGVEPQPLTLWPGARTLELRLPAVQSATTARLSLEVKGCGPITRNLSRKPVRPLEIFLLPHSHVDIGYTALQADVAKKQIDNIETGLRLAQATANYPEGARFKWNVEVLWPVENYLKAATPEKREAFLRAVRTGQIGLDAFYGNTLTGLCRPEELIQLMGYASRLSLLCGLPIESAMISDVPGYTWSTVTAMGQAGVKYFSFAPNYFDRMGGTMKEWQNRPFWWKGPDGQTRILCWCPSRGYALGHLIGDGEALARFIPSYLHELETNSYPYDITHLRWNVHGDNGSPDEKLSDVVRAWNARYAYPRLTIATTAVAFREFERRYGTRLPGFSGDYTPYWEDGAGSSAFETALNRASDERLVQAEAIWAIHPQGPFPAEAFHQAWRSALLYSEHTWGAHNSISQPDLPFVRDQWKVKQGFALDADAQSRRLLGQAAGPVDSATFDVFNTCSWSRTDLVLLPAAAATAGDRVVDADGRAVTSQRLATHELAFLASSVPPFGAKRYHVEAGSSQGPADGPAKADGQALVHPEFTLRIDARTGAISSWLSRYLNQELVDEKAATALNDFFYLPGSDLEGLERNGPPKITVGENGPLVAALLLECNAPGCRRLLRQVRIVAGLDRVELIDTIDKLPVRTKEGLHFGFGFNVPNPTVRLDVGMAVVRPELDQIPASCKNWFSIQRWVDVSNDRFGVTLAPVDAPLIEVGGITANLIGSQTDPSVWIQHIESSPILYSWVMNNHWHTNYRAEQEGPTVFRFFLRAHAAYSALDATRFGSECSQPLIVAHASAAQPAPPRLRLSSDRVVVMTLKPSDDGQATIARLLGASGQTEEVTLDWSAPAPRRMWLSGTAEQRGTPISNPVRVPAWGVVTVRAE
jgi:hypothetical protein